MTLYSVFETIHTFAMLFHCELLVPPSFVPASHLLSDKQGTTDERKLHGYIHKCTGHGWLEVGLCET